MKLKTFLLTLLLEAAPLYADVAPENYGETTLGTTSTHTVLINTFADQVLVYDAGSEEIRGTLSVGNGTNALEIDKDRGVIYAAETYLSRHTRGERTDVVTTYDINTLSAVSEIEIPARRATGSPMRHYSGIVTGGDTRLMLVANITPAVSISIIDLVSGRFLNEINTAGCGLVYPVSDLRFLQLCGDGTAQLVRLNADGGEQKRIRSDSFFDLMDDPLMEKGVKTPSGWVFNSFKGQVFKLSAPNDEIVVQKLFDITEPAASEDWRIGGMQPLAYHQGADLLLALMHSGGKGSHKDPGTHIWYYNLGSGQRLHQLSLERMASSIQVSQDDEAVIYAGSFVTDTVDVYDLKSGRLQRTLEDLPTPTILQNL